MYEYLIGWSPVVFETWYLSRFQYSFYSGNRTNNWIEIRWNILCTKCFSFLDSPSWGVSSLPESGHEGNESHSFPLSMLGNRMHQTDRKTFCFLPDLPRVQDVSNEYEGLTSASEGNPFYTPCIHGWVPLNVSSCDNAWNSDGFSLRYTQGIQSGHPGSWYKSMSWFRVEVRLFCGPSTFQFLSVDRFDIRV